MTHFLIDHLTLLVCSVGGLCENNPPSFLYDETSLRLEYSCCADYTHPSFRFCSRCISNGNRTEWSPIRSVIIRVITKSDDRAAGVQFVYHE